MTETNRISDNIMLDGYSPQSYEDLDCAAYRKLYPAETKPLSDKQLYDIIAATDDDMSDDEWRALFRKADPITAKIRVGEGQHIHALQMARKAAPTMDAAILVAVDAKEEWTGAPIKLAVAIAKDFTDEEISSFPRIGSSWKDQTTDNPEVYMYQDKEAGDDKPKEYNWYVTWSDNRPEGLKILEELKWCRLSLDNEADKSKIHPDFKRAYQNDMAVRRRKGYLNTRRGDVRKAHKNAVKLLHQMDAVNELANVRATFVPSEDKGWESIIQVQSTVPARMLVDYSHFTVQQFLKLDTKVAAEHGGTLEALKATLERAAKTTDPTKTGVPALASIKTPATADTVLTAVHLYFDDVYANKKGEDYANLLKFCTSPEGENFVLTIGNLKRIFTDLFAFDKIAGIYAVAEEKNAQATADLNRPKAPPALVEAFKK